MKSSRHPNRQLQLGDEGKLQNLPAASPRLPSSSAQPIPKPPCKIISTHPTHDDINLKLMF